MIPVNGVTNEIRICEKGERERCVKVTAVEKDNIDLTLYNEDVDVDWKNNLSKIG